MGRRSSRGTDQLDHLDVMRLPVQTQQEREQLQDGVYVIVRSRYFGVLSAVMLALLKKVFQFTLKEILPLLILPLPAYFPLFTYLSLFFIYQKYLTYLNLTILLIFLLVSSAPGLITVLSFALHRCFTHFYH